jgi:restriction system protein
MSIPDFQTLMLPVLRATASSEISAPALRQQVAQSLDLTESDLAEMLPSGRQTTFTNRTAWALVYLQRAGLIEKISRGVYKATGEGQRVLDGGPDRIDKAFLAQYPSYVEWRRRSATGDVVTGGSDSAEESRTPEELIEASHASLSSALETDLLDRVRELSPAFFENLIIDLLIAMGYGGGRSEMGQAMGRAGDGGVDGMIKEDALGLDIVYVQAKRYADGNTVGRAEVQSFAGSLDGVGATKGIFFGTFSKSAREYVGRISKRIILIDGAELAALMVRNNVGVRTRTTYEIKKVDEDYFTE